MGELDVDVGFVSCAGYKLPHPLEHKILVKVETTSDSNPKKAMQLALSRLKEEFTSIDEKFKFEMPKFIQDQSYQPGDDYL